MVDKSRFLGYTDSLSELNSRAHTVCEESPSFTGQDNG